MVNVGGGGSDTIVASVDRRSLARVDVLVGDSGLLAAICGFPVWEWLSSLVLSALGF
jgi:hypothetical protein